MTPITCFEKVEGFTLTNTSILVLWHFPELLIFEQHGMKEEQLIIHSFEHTIVILSRLLILNTRSLGEHAYQREVLRCMRMPFQLTRYSGSSQSRSKWALHASIRWYIRFTYSLPRTDPSTPQLYILWKVTRLTLTGQVVAHRFPSIRTLSRYVSHLSTFFRRARGWRQ